jgi:tetratricopeptide (TPR) repeat protein
MRGLHRTHSRIHRFGIFLCTVWITWAVSGAELQDAQQLLRGGDYEKAAKLAREAIEESSRDEEWPILAMEALTSLGRYAEAQSTASEALRRLSRSVRIRLAAYHVFKQVGDAAKAREMLAEINQRGTMLMRNEPSAEDAVALGQAALLLGAEPKLVLENIFNPTKKKEPKVRGTHLAIGNLGLDKGDFALAARAFQDGLEHFPDDPDLLCGLGRSFAPGDRSEMLAAIEKALEVNSRHIPSLLLLVDHLIDAEEYDKAGKTLEQIDAINPSRPEAWAYRAVLAHLKNDLEQEKQSREKALSVWKENPGVDHLIGLKLSQKYRFQEGSDYQRRALQFDASYLPSQIQLAQDLLRLGDTDGGWKLAEEVHKRDGYDVVAYNLVTLQDTLSKFTVLTNGPFVVRMHPREADIYGKRVLDLLDRARAKLCQKYGLELDRPVFIEIFPEQKDFAVRTFGMPGGEGYLGVCFGHVVTANSPASQGASPSNWEAVLWHEFCHVVTLGITRNKMPRWLSEGISVYEERQANPTWGQSMLPAYREIILKGELTPIGDLSSAFLAPGSGNDKENDEEDEERNSGLYLQFAYYESSLVVEYLVEKFGIEALKSILKDLGTGRPINEAIAAHTAPLPELEKEFAELTIARAKDLAPGLDWKKPKPADLEGAAALWTARDPRNFYILTQKAKKLLSEKKFEEAKEPARKLLEEFPSHVEGDNPYLLLAAAHRGLGETDEEYDILARLASRSADSTDVYLRLMELASAREKWRDVRLNAERFLAVNPLIAPPHRFRGRAAEELGERENAIEAYENVLRFQPSDLADVHFRLAKLYRTEDAPRSKRHLLQALEEAPRFESALQMLLEESRKADPPAPPAEPSKRSDARL